MSLLWVAKSEWWSRMLVGARSLSHTNSNEVEVAREKEACRERPRGIEEAGGLRQRRSMRATEEAACVRQRRQHACVSQGHATRLLHRLCSLSLYYSDRGFPGSIHGTTLLGCPGLGVFVFSRPFNFCDLFVGFWKFDGNQSFLGSEHQYCSSVD